MIEVKFHKGLSKVYGISRSEFLEATKESEPYMHYIKGRKEAFAICPLCENPVKLLGVYARLEKQRPHARHLKKNVPGLADFDEYKYLQCPYHRENANYIMEAKSREDMTEYNKEILALAHDYFDKCIYILRKTTGLVISDKLAEEIAADYMMHPGYMTYDITRENIPYIMGMCMSGKNLVKRMVEENSPLYEMLKDKKDITLEPMKPTFEYKSAKTLYRIESKEGYLGISFNITRYRFATNKTSELREYLKLHIGMPDGKGTYNTYAEKEIEVDPFFFNRLIHSRNTRSPRSGLADIADRILTLETSEN